MAILPDGWAEFNDVSAVIRGHMAGGKGTFSGTFSSDQVNSIKEINLKDGCVSSWYHYSPLNKIDYSFVVPAHQWSMMHEIIIPIKSTFIYYDFGDRWPASTFDRRFPRVELIVDNTISIIGMPMREDDSLSDYAEGENLIFYELTYIRFVNVALSNQDVVYRVRDIPGNTYFGFTHSDRRGTRRWWHYFRTTTEIYSKVHVAVWKR